MNNSRFMVVIIVGLGLLLFGLTAFTVNERELARLRSELEVSPRLKALLKRLVEG